MQAAPANTDEKPSLTTLLERTPSLSNNPIDVIDLLSTVIFVGLSAVAVYYGWRLGKQNGPYFWSIIQVIGSTIRSYLLQFIGYAQEYARRSR
jgi:hypothetical protein